MLSKFMRGASLLSGNNTIPGEVLSEEEKKLFRQTLDACSCYGLDYFPTIIQKLTYNQMSEIAALGGFPKRFRHWSFGQEYEQLQKSYEHGMSKIYEMVINSSPSIIYILASNTLVDNITVVAHATGHNDFFKNNIYFSQTCRDMVNKMANHGSRIDKYMSRWGYGKVTEFIDHCLRIQTLIDPAKAWDVREIKTPIYRDTREYEFPRRLEAKPHMDKYINTPEYIEHEKNRIKEKELAEELGFLKEPDKDIFGYIRDNAPFKPWQADIAGMLHDEAMYYHPQRISKTLNEGFASKIDYEIMAKQGLVGLGQKTHDSGIFHYAIHKMGVLGGKYSQNVYKLGFYLLEDIEERWNKGWHGTEYEQCKNLKQKAEWDTKENKGKEKIFEVRKYYNDFTFIHEFFTEEFCDKFEFYEWKRQPNGEYVIASRDYKKIKKKLMASKLNGGLPDIRLVDPNHRNRGWMLLQHYDDDLLYEPYARETLCSLYYLWGKEIILSTHDSNGKEAVFVCAGMDSDKDVALVTRAEYEKTW